MSYEGSCEVLRGACAFTLGDEPLAGRVEYRALERWVVCPELGVGFDDLVHRQTREEPVFSGGGIAE